jgi:hypothetical protein
MNKLFTAMFLFCITFTASASDSGDHWFEVQSPHFRVLTDSNERQARHLAAQFELMRSVFHILMPNATDNPASPIVVLA